MNTDREAGKMKRKGKSVSRTPANRDFSARLKPVRDLIVAVLKWIVSPFCGKMDASVRY